MKSKSDEEEMGIYITSFDVYVKVPSSDMNFYRLLQRLREDGLIDDFGHRTYELQMLTYGYKIVA